MRTSSVPQERVLVEIEGMTHDGNGFANVAGRTVYIFGALTGEKVNFRYTRIKGTQAEGVVDEVLQPSPERVPAACPQFGLCGGCSLQHQHPVAQISAPARAARPLSSPAGETRRPELGARPTTSRSRDTLTGPVVAVPPVDLRNEPTASQELAPTAEGSHSHQHARDLEQTAAHLPVDPAEQLGDDATTRAHRM